MRTVYDNEAIIDQITGTLVAALILRDTVFLFSDGRAVRASDGTIINDAHSKVHRLTLYSGMLTLGRHIPDLTSRISDICEQRKIIFVDDVVKEVASVLIGIWNQPSIQQQRTNDDTFRIFVFVSGFDSSGSAKIFYLDSRTEPAFRLQERELFLHGQDIEIAAMSFDSGVEENPSARLTTYIKALLRGRTSIPNFGNIFHQAFSAVKNDLSKIHPHIGGQVFSDLISAPNKG